MWRGSTSAMRRLCVLALLLGLVGMHGLAFGQAGGCHGGGPTMIASMAAPASGPVTTPLIGAERGMIGANTGASCVSVQSPGWPGLSLPLVAIAWMAGGLTARQRWTAGDASQRSPPLAGIVLLRRVCVSLT